ncbi:MAG: hypothetical protein JWP82_904 [Humibacillus sp.]|nr:hypothetical protein [Humibacillus sp.]
MLAIVISSLKRKLTNRSVLLNIVVMPLLLIVILGNALAATFSTSAHSSSATGATSLGVVDLDGSPASRDLAGFLTGTGAFVLTPEATPAAGAAALAAGSVDVLATIPSGYGRDQTAGGAPTVALSAVDSRIDQLRASELAVDALSDARRSSVAAASVTAHPTAYASGQFVTQRTSTADDPAAGVSGITYYTITMLVLILVYGLGNTMNFVKEEYDGPLGDRYLASPTGRLTLVTAQVVAGTLTSLVQASVIVATSVLVFRADLGDRPVVAAAIVVIAALLFNTVGLLLGLLGRTRTWLDPLVSLLIPVMTFLGGGFVKLDFGGLDRLTVNSIFQSAFFREVTGYATQWTPLLACLAVAAVALAASGVMIKGTAHR